MDNRENKKEIYERDRQYLFPWKNRLNDNKAIKT